MARVPNNEEILPKISTGWVGRTNLTYRRRRQTDRTAIAYYSERDREFTFANKIKFNIISNALRCLHQTSFRTKLYSRTLLLVESNMAAILNSTRSSAIAEGPRDALCQLKCCKLLHSTTIRKITFERLAVEMTLKVTQSYRNCLYWIGHTSLPISSNNDSIWHRFRLSHLQCTWLAATFRSPTFSRRVTRTHQEMR